MAGLGHNFAELCLWDMLIICPAKHSLELIGQVI